MSIGFGRRICRRASADVRMISAAVLLQEIQEAPHRLVVDRVEDLALLATRGDEAGALQFLQVKGQTPNGYTKKGRISTR